MPNAIALRPDFDASALRGLARRSKDAAQARRLLSLAVVSDGGSLEIIERGPTATPRR